MGTPTIAVWVVSDQPIVVAGVLSLLLGQEADASEFQTAPDSTAADVVLYDSIRLAAGDEDPEAELRAILEAHPGRVLVLSTLLHPGLTARAVVIGAVAAVVPRATAAELSALVESAASGAWELDRKGGDRTPAVPQDELVVAGGLTPREGSVLALIASGRSNQEIAAELYLSINTIKSIVRRVYRRMQVTSRSQAVAWAIDHGYGR